MNAPATDEVDPALECELPPAPYPGLRPFEKREWPIFFGREQTANEVIERIVRQRLVVVHGDSGCGKSSLIYAGVLPTLEQEAVRGGARWLTAFAAPGDAPLWNLARALAPLRGDGSEAEMMAIRRALNLGRDGAKAAAELLRLAPNERVCILVDQFEELFAHAKGAGSTDARLLIEFLIGVQQQRPEGIYAVLTMRSEFLGACAKFEDFAEAVNAAQYLLPRMERSDLVRAIREPATVFDGQITRELSERLIDDAGGTQDQLPLVQHGLMLLYRKHVLEGESHGAPGWKLGLEHYRDSAADLSALLSDHADEIAGRVDPAALSTRSGERGGPRPVEDLFRALTDINAEGHAIRRPQTLQRLLDVTLVKEERLRAIIDAFRVDGVSLLRPYGDAVLGLDDRVDISHEALIRCWKRIAEPQDGWLIREFKNGLLWRSLLVQADSFDIDPSAVLSPTTTRQRAVWLERRNLAWCERYGGGWDRVQKLLTASLAATKLAEDKAKSDMLKEVEAAQSARSKRRLRYGIALVAVLAAVAFALAAYAFGERKAADLARSNAEKAQRTAESTLAALKAATSAAVVADNGRVEAEQRTAQVEKTTDIVQHIAAQQALDEAKQRLGSLLAKTDDGKARQAIAAAQGELTQQAASLSVTAPASKLPPRIYMQISEEGQQKAALRLTQQMAKLKVGADSLSVIPPAGVQRAKGNSLRCFRDDECVEARQLLALVNPLLVSPQLVLQDLSAVYGNSKTMRSRHYEIWFAPGGIELAK